jgi:hypothetical protein
MSLGYLVFTAQFRPVIDTSAYNECRDDSQNNQYCDHFEHGEAIIIFEMDIYQFIH